MTNPLKYDTIRVQKEMARLLDSAEIVCESRAMPKRLESALANLEKKIKECLTNHQKCDIIKIQKERETSPSGVNRGHSPQVGRL